MAENRKQTSGKVGSLAAKVLSNPNASATAKRLAGSDLSQMAKGKQTGAEMENFASKVLQSSKYSDETKTLAGSVLSQANKKR